MIIESAVESHFTPLMLNASIIIGEKKEKKKKEENYSIFFNLVNLTKQ